MDKTVIISEKAPRAIGPYAVAVRTGELVFTAGQIGLDPATGSLVPGGVDEQTRQVLDNLQNVLADAGSGLDRVVKSTVFLKEMVDFPIMNSVYAEYFPENPPARSTVAVAGLPKGALVEIEVIALVK
jgi:2-iminobutanoate/2-iminopropanoate deaminase